ncbi:capsular exopolysaccharide synthesis family protein [Gramella sp. Hel_I_59]|uniref:GumC family protein n=1 Tax=Gramella sp. Hel_I_59 TaxID=1249978 RepID=UPI0011520BCD|nr:tyrosine-protein kinase [Gramella sp. Hel_I_59]TQI71930.1 capsular exopolysaccharide synthesis family protein [Gramella sp. Hel_I_59]
MSQTSKNPSTKDQNELNLRDEAEKYLRYWPWFVASVIFSLLIAYINLRYTVPIYSTSATIIIKDENSGGGSEFAMMQDLGMFSGMGSNSIENELGILKSRELMQDVMQSLNFTTSYYAEGNVRTTEIYQGSPLLVEILNKNSAKETLPNLQISKPVQGAITITNLSSQQSYKANLGEAFVIGETTLVVRDNSNGIDIENFNYYPLKVVFNNPVSLANSYRSQLQVKLEDYNSTLVNLGLNDPIKEKAQDILDQLIFEYNRQAIEDKNLVARNTAQFIDERLALITGELDSVESGKKEFKQDNNLTDIQSESQLFIESASEFNKKMQEIETQLELSRSMLNFMNQENDSDLLPSNLGLEGSGLNEYIAQYNELVLQRDRILAGSTEKNPVVINLNTQIEQLKSNIFSSIQNVQTNLQIARDDLNRQSAVIGGKISAVPGKEQEFRGIERQQNIKEALYLFLLQKREENSLTLAITAPKAKIVDSAYSSGTPVSPNKRSIYLTALLIGLGIPFAIVYLKNLLNNKVRTKEDITGSGLSIPIVGEIPRLAKGQNELIQENDRSVLAESFRLMHTNLQYFLAENSNEINQRATTIFVTSTVKGEGKTFIAFNLAKTLANTGKKVLIMGADLRNPQLQRFQEEAKSWLGVSNYLVDRNLHIQDLIKNSSIHPDLDILTSGSIPPNPSELLRSHRLEELFEQVKELYDYILVDTAPAMVVADTFLIGKHADLTLYSVRADYTERKLLNFIGDAKDDQKLKNAGLVLNSVKSANYGYGKYGYSYGYAYGVESQGFWEKLKTKLKS